MGEIFLHGFSQLRLGPPSIHFRQIDLICSQNISSQLEDILFKKKGLPTRTKLCSEPTKKLPYKCLGGKSEEFFRQLTIYHIECCFWFD